jgi:hypothetical protein
MNYVRIGVELFRVVITKSFVVWDITPCSPLKSNRCFGGKHILLLHSSIMTKETTFPSEASVSFKLVHPEKKLKLLYDWLTDRQSLCLGVGHLFGAHHQILLFSFFCRKIVLLFVMERPLWREDGSVICSAICQWSESQRIHNHILLSNLRLLSFFCRLLRLTGITVEVSLPASTRGIQKREFFNDVLFDKQKMNPLFHRKWHFHNLSLLNLNIE